MSALEVVGEQSGGDARDRPTIPVPRESGVRLHVAQIATCAATVDIVVCDLTRDPRSESYVPRRPAKRSGLWTLERSASSEQPPSTSTIQALK
ncbi:MAG: hypothetical protein JWP97_2861 [Labilithrix sp.]|nr:hypothetical protein [Labilithrix sp.]